MPQGVKRFIDVSITKETALTTAAGFGVPLLLTDNVTVITTTTRVKEYLSLSAVETDFAIGTDEHSAAQAFFKQDPNNKNFPTKLLIGCWDKNNSTPESITVALDAIRAIMDDWYALGVTASIRTATADLTALATYIEALPKIMILDNNDANSLVLGETTSLLAILKAEGTMGYKRTMIVYHDDITLYPAWAIMGEYLPLQPGSSQVAYHKLADATAGAVYIRPAKLTEVEKDNLFSKNGNAVVASIGAEFIYPGTMTGGRNLDREGEWFDIIRSIDFLTARTTEKMLSLLLEKANNGEKVPYTNAGIAMVQTRLVDTLEKFGVATNILVDKSIVTSVPKRSDTSVADRDSRILRNVDFTADLAGAIVGVVVRGKVRV